MYVLLFDACRLTCMAGACDANTGGGCDEWGGTRNDIYSQLSQENYQGYPPTHICMTLCITVTYPGGLPDTYTQACS